MKNIVLVILSIAFLYLLFTKTNLGETIMSKINDIMEPQEELLTAPSEKPANNDQEIKEILRLTRVINDLEESLKSVSSEYSQLDGAKTEGNMSIDQHQELLSRIDKVKTKLAEDQATISQLQDQIKAYKSENQNINKIKKLYGQMLNEKNAEIANLSGSITRLQETLAAKEKVIEDQGVIIQEQTTVIEQQKEVIQKLSVKHLLLYSRKQTRQYTIEGNQVQLFQKLRKVELVSEHAEGSYSLSEQNGSAVLTILDEENFWAGNNFVIIKVKSGTI